MKKIAPHLYVFANRKIVGIQRTGDRPWQIDFMFGPWRPFSYRQGIRPRKRQSIDLGRIGIFRWGYLERLGD